MPGALPGLPPPRAAPGPLTSERCDNGGDPIEERLRAAELRGLAIGRTDARSAKNQEHMRRIAELQGKVAELEESRAQEANKVGGKDTDQ